LGDLIVAGESAYFLQAFRRIGLVPDGSATYHLPRMIGRARAMEMMLLGEKIHAKQAHEWGLVNRYVPDADLLPTAKALALELANGPTKTLGMIRRLSWSSLDNSWDEQLDADLQRFASPRCRLIWIIKRVIRQTPIPEINRLASARAILRCPLEGA
ncbi:MAG: enoyl-CoA hydratase-related protein, partial [Terricaulis sp.]